MAKYTLTYDDGVDGFPSFYTYYPDWIQGMNNYLYTFKGGNLYRHNTNERRNNFYGEDFASVMTSVFNAQPLEPKLFKTIELESDDSWATTADTNQESGNFINSVNYKLKEGSFFGFLRSENPEIANPSQYPLRSANGIGNNVSVDNTNPSAVRINFSTDPLVSIGSILSIGDHLYLRDSASGDVVLIGEIKNKVVNLQAGDNYLIVDTTITGSSGAVIGILPPTDPQYYFFIKNGTAESHGILGHYVVFTLTNNNTNAVELFAVDSDVMKSFP